MQKHQVIGLRRKDLYSWSYISLTIVYSEFLQHPADMKKMFYNVLPQIFFLTILFSRMSKSLSMGVFVDGS